MRMSKAQATAIASGAAPKVYWTDRSDAPEQTSELRGDVRADLAIIGGGYTGLWAAIQALEDDPGISVVILEAERCGFGASSRNGGFCDGSLTHGLHNGLSHWPDEMPTLHRLARETFDGIEATVERYDIAADFHRSAKIDVATEPWLVREIVESAETHRGAGLPVDLLDADEMRACVDSPTYLGGIRTSADFALVDPARLVWGLQRAAESLGAQIFEHSPAVGVQEEGSNLVVRAEHGTVTADRVVMATNAYRGVTRRPRRYVIPVYDHVVMTEPLTSEQMASVKWAGREGLGDASNQFHYYRLTEDNRILYGGWDAAYHFNNGVKPEYEQSATTHPLLVADFFETFPQLEGLGISHTWGGVIATTTRFNATWGTSCGGRMTWVAGYTGLGVGASRFGARVALDLVFGRSTERTELEMVRRKPFPFPPEPIRSAGVHITRRAIQRADENEGKRGMWLALLDRFGIGFDS